MCLSKKYRLCRQGFGYNSLHGAQRGAALITWYQAKAQAKIRAIMAETKDKLDRLRAKRGGYRGVCTKLTKETEEIIHADEIDYDRCEVIRSLLEEKSKICEIASIE